MKKLCYTLAVPLALFLIAPSAEGAALAEAPKEVIAIRQPGPPLWKVSKGDHELWIFPYLAITPSDMDWQSDAVAHAIAQSQEYIGLPRQEADSFMLQFLNPLNLVRGYRLLRAIQRHPDGSPLEQSLSPEVYARYAAMKSSYFPHEVEIDDLRPLFAGGRMAILIREAAGLTENGDILDTIWKHARRNRTIKLTDVALDIQVDDSFSKLADRAQTSLTNLSREEEQTCFEQRLRHFEQDLAHLKRRANTWALGELDGFRSTPPVSETSGACVELILKSAESLPPEEVNARLEQMWLDAAQAALAANTSTFAVLHIDDLIRADGPLHQLKAMGYEVREP